MIYSPPRWSRGGWSFSGQIVEGEQSSSTPGLTKLWPVHVALLVPSDCLQATIIHIWLFDAMFLCQTCNVSLPDPACLSHCLFTWLAWCTSTHLDKQNSEFTICIRGGVSTRQKTLLLYINESTCTCNTCTAWQLSVHFLWGYIPFISPPPHSQYNRKDRFHSIPCLHREGPRRSRALCR